MLGRSWYTVLLICLTVIYSVTEHHLMDVMNFPKRKGKFSLLLACFFNIVICVIWTETTLPLWSFYILIYLVRFTGHYCGRIFRKSDFFYLNFDFVNMISLHLIIIAVSALVKEVPMPQLLSEPYWRAVSMAVCIVINLFESFIALRTGFLIDTLAAEKISEEAGLFMTFSWFTTGSLLLDSLMCSVDQALIYTPLFLIGSSVILLYLQFLFLWNIRSFTISRQLKDENVRLEAELSAKSHNAGLLRNLTYEDALTGACSRRFMLEQLEALLKKEELFSLIYLDLDHLKQINDRDGHDAGDRYLQEFVRKMKALLRPEDIFARVGGDEFVIVLPKCTKLTAQERISEIRELIMEESGCNRYGFSFGATEWTVGDQRGAELLIQDADRMMYQDKERVR